MEEVSGPVVAVGLVLAAVFVPCAFISGITGQFFRQFALTVAVSTVLSAFNSLTLSPALAALLLKPHGPGEHGHAAGREALPRLGVVLIIALVAAFLVAPLFIPKDFKFGWLVRLGAGLAGAVVGWFLTWMVNWVLGHFFRGFNWAFERSAHGYGRSVGVL